MALSKCPRCELNYAKKGETYCDVCLKELKRIQSRMIRAEDEEEHEAGPILCTECGEHNAVKGSELCAECLREQKRQQELENAADLNLDLDVEPPEEEEEEE